MGKVKLFNIKSYTNVNPCYVKESEDYKISMANSRPSSSNLLLKGQGKSMFYDGLIILFVY